jgi:hypothetical protein
LESLSYLKRRGVLLGILSKNDDAKARAIWQEMYGRYFPIEEFAAVQINWNSKAENMAAILKAVNILPSRVVFVDDNLVELAAMVHSFPRMRTLGRVERIAYVECDALENLPEGLAIEIDHGAADAQQRASVGQVFQSRDRRSANTVCDLMATDQAPS